MDFSAAQLSFDGLVGKQNGSLFLCKRRRSQQQRNNAQHLLKSSEQEIGFAGIQHKFCLREKERRCDDLRSFELLLRKKYSVGSQADLTTGGFGFGVCAAATFGRTFARFLFWRGFLCSFFGRHDKTPLLVGECSSRLHSTAHWRNDCCRVQNTD
jgi:hypothetical protein